MAEGTAGVGVVILADDLIWSTRLEDAVRAAGGEPSTFRRAEDLSATSGTRPQRVIVDLTARAYDAIEAIRSAAASGARVIAVGQHDDRQLQRRAREAGAEQVHAYRRLFEDGPGVIARWLGE